MTSPRARRERIDPAKLFKCPLVWRVDQEHEFWLKAEYEGNSFAMRINPTFPDTPLYSLLIDEDETVDFDDLPDAWKREGPLDWGAERPGSR